MVTRCLISLAHTVRVWKRGLRSRRRRHPADLPAPDVHRGLPEHHLPLQEQRSLHGSTDRQPQEIPAPPGFQRDRAPGRGQQPLHLQHPCRWLHGESPRRGQSTFLGFCVSLLADQSDPHSVTALDNDSPPTVFIHSRVTPEVGARQSLNTKPPRPPACPSSMWLPWTLVPQTRNSD